jgi:hypothetical protein
VIGTAGTLLLLLLLSGLWMISDEIAKKRKKKGKREKGQKTKNIRYKSIHKYGMKWAERK